MKQELEQNIQQFRARFPVEEEAADRIRRPEMEYIGDEVLEQAALALLQGENLLLVGDKATGKNILAETLAWQFGRPLYNVSFHVNTDSSSLIGTDTFADGRVTLRKGPITAAAEAGGFCVLDEINMAKNDAIAVLHAALDHRRMIDIPGYHVVNVHPAARFIATMNYGYAGTRELNEALCSRFAVIRMPALHEQRLMEILQANVPGARPQLLEKGIALFMDLNQKAIHGEISTRSVDLRGLIVALKMATSGLDAVQAIHMGLVNKCFDEYEHRLVADVVLTRFAS